WPGRTRIRRKTTGASAVTSLVALLRCLFLFEAAYAFGGFFEPEIRFGKCLIKPEDEFSGHVRSDVAIIKQGKCKVVACRYGAEQLQGEIPADAGQRHLAVHRDRLHQFTGN